MIEISPTTALMLYLCATLFVLLGLWIVQHYRTRTKIILPMEKNMHTCEFCHFSYLAEDSKKISQCPQCHSFQRMRDEG